MVDCVRLRTIDDTFFVIKGPLKKTTLAAGNSFYKLLIFLNLLVCLPHLVPASILNNAVGVGSISSHGDVVTMNTELAIVLVQGLEGRHIGRPLHNLVRGADKHEEDVD